MKILNLVALLFAGFISSKQLNAFPVLTDFRLKPTIVLQNKKKVALVKKQLIKMPFAVLTEGKQNAEILVNNFDSLTIYPNSKFQILDMTGEEGYVSDLYLINGSMRYKVKNRKLLKEGEKDESPILHTPFFDLKIGFTADFIVTLDMKEPSIEVKVVDGVVPVEYFSYEKKVNLKAGEKVKFQGVLADTKDAIQYDYLLNNRKVPKGKLLEIQSFDYKELVKQEQAIVDGMKKAAQERINKELELKRKQKAYEDSFLCKQPFGQKDQCNWVIKDNSCFRTRCNVDGKWFDKTERPLGDCKTYKSVTDCDF